MPDSASVFVVHPDPQVRNSVRALADSMQVHCQSFATPCDFLAEEIQHPFGCLLTVASAPDRNGVDLLHELRSRSAPFPVIMTSPRPDPSTEVKALRSGALDFLVNPDGKILESAIRRGLEAAESLWRRRQWRMQAHEVVNEIQCKLERLSEGEQAVLHLVLQGELNKTVARHLDVSVRTVEQRRRNIMIKMEADSLPQLVQQMTKLQLLREMLE